MCIDYPLKSNINDTYNEIYHHHETSLTFIIITFVQNVKHFFTQKHIF